MNSIIDVMLKNRKIAKVAFFIRNLPRRFELYNEIKKELIKLKSEEDRIFYFGAARHANLGDLAQSVCIRKWLNKHYNMEVIEIETNAVVNTPFSVLPLLDKVIKENDIIVFQSGYTTTDLGGFADEMHRVVMEHFPKNAMLMLPQTIFFKSKENEIRTSNCYDSINRLLFLARDKVSYNKALTMFPNTRVELFPDIVTTMIGSRQYSYSREGILFCCRNDEEKFYSDTEINNLIKKCEEIACVERTDTTKTINKNEIVKKSEEYILSEIDRYAHYKLIVTDRYHGTILSLVAGTPVVLLKTTDHKVITGADWFKGIYDEYVYVSNGLNDAFKKIQTMMAQERDYILEPYFEKEYYDKLPELFDGVRGGY